LNGLRTIRVENTRHLRFATEADFRRVFKEEMNSLFALAALLTTDFARAEECFCRALDGSLDALWVSIERAGSWARRAVVNQAIQLIAPRRERTQSPIAPVFDWPETSSLKNPVAALCSLEPFERFVVVMTLLEKQSDSDCALQLECTRQDVGAARVSALRKLCGLCQ
jgi:DNA-directed RNA polymerase specialized sigma24 family protein